ncbi:hypothetical protein SAMN04515617_114142 [Collimonas sp. OK242]|jgi:hypothetical protein|uniref:hypothetical protein n=1 Tax=Collimonas sp. OK242 TaxID=1798195 RepID=UPI000899DE20|nr:hypothetical protein [Collimonas sp. OK242]SDY45106.1 hypothetical protein SAMN04515617_114142 [Collimonas sp. OK242]
MGWFNKLATKYILTPEKMAENELRDTRLGLYQSERQLLEAEMRVDYYRNVLSFLEAISVDGVESVAESQRSKLPSQPQIPQRRAPDLSSYRGGA